MAASTSSNQLVSKHEFADVMENTVSGQKSLHANVHFNAEDVICSFDAELTLDHPTYATVQIDDHTHIILKPEFLLYVNHSCSPNVFFNTDSMQLIALTEIQSGDEIVFFYPSVEWDMERPFNCFCGSSNCLKQIKGAAYLPHTVIQQYHLTDFIRQKINNQK
ncbi:unnamed protein product [Adineta steineri]|uniref:SET domain-containing protein n=1 Tax=Adineta steineri TaxID=433720 RepID=A0A815I6M9_9BILA|nr:unnamed protein product [Adineta steineri]CAF4093928.1 unnamed protein product [Adineta steineri]